MPTKGMVEAAAVPATTKRVVTKTVATKSVKSVTAKPVATKTAKSVTAKPMTAKTVATKTMASLSQGNRAGRCQQNGKRDCEEMFRLFHDHDRPSECQRRVGPE